MKLFFWIKKLTFSFCGGYTLLWVFMLNFVFMGPILADNANTCAEIGGHLLESAGAPTCVTQETALVGTIQQFIGPDPNRIREAKYIDCVAGHFSAVGGGNVSILVSQISQWKRCLNEKKDNPAAQYPRAYNRCSRLVIGNFERAEVRFSDDLGNGMILDDSVAFCDWEPWPYGPWRELGYCSKKTLPPPYLNGIDGESSVQVLLSKFPDYEACLAEFQISLDTWID